jgi:beta-lactam-binding protein with PASTA domain
VALPDLKGTSIKDAVTRLKILGLNPVVLGDSTAVVKQFPLAGAELNAGAAVTLYGTMVAKMPNDGIEVPDLIGKSMREAVQNLVQSNLKVQIQGTGVVKTQEPTPGTIVKYGTVCTIACYKR